MGARRQLAATEKSLRQAEETIHRLTNRIHQLEADRGDAAEFADLRVAGMCRTLGECVRNAHLLDQLQREDS